MNGREKLHGFPSEVTRQPIFAQKQARIQFQRRKEYAERAPSKRGCIIGTTEGQSE